eukprot:TRINITY_DN37423_c0_g1_i1.p1 TRINITY_DN37423_c0_g1~~TRINITY_DN37423_c0_g1_i1.p1  ORF type:complete len:220 (+),score=35.58 TRINITY_DN37423_c0_g1_i1:79-738(+)
MLRLKFVFLFLCAARWNTVTAQMACAAEGVKLCAADIAAIDTPLFAKDLLRAGMLSFGRDVYGALKQVVEQRLGDGSVSDDCLRCQAQTIECGSKRSSCLPKCVSSSCSYECRECQQANCSVAKACGGTPAVHIQSGYSCAAGGNDLNAMTFDARLTAVPGVVNCTSTVYPTPPQASTSEEANTSAKDPDAEVSAALTWKTLDMTTALSMAAASLAAHC